MYKATGTQSYLVDGGNIARATIATFTVNGVFADTCEASRSCAQNAAQPKGTMIRGLGYLASITNIAADKAAIQAAMAASTTAMLKTCDGNMNCNVVWATPAQPPSNFHDQLDVMELINAYTQSLNGLSAVTFSAPTATTTTTSTTKSGADSLKMSAWIALVVAGLFLCLA